ncbi:thymidine phosphorylase [Melittangium boletus]|uniref:thymidine phosphorylase n=1 Tax=Melittangium boletus TaxID=83453 RepID=UPI003DA2C625
MRPYELIKAKRDGKRLRADDIQAFLRAYTDGEVPDYQMSALCMAIFFRGLDAEELSAWAQAMLHSGEVLDLSDIPGTKVDKHSTGGVGDKVSLSLAPLAAACGVPVPMISGRGLGHTGGTLDKLESIPGFQINLPVSEYRRLVRELDCCLIGQTASVAPADKKLYALRDVTATVDCIPLIASSIMSKKLASGLDALVLDVKVGSGAFMKTQEDARTLARTMIDIGAQMGRKVTALLTDMNQPLGRAVGNALEVVEAVEMLRGRAPEDYTEVTLALTAEMLVLGGKARSLDEARARLQRVIEDGSAVRKLQQIVEAQGGDPRSIEDYARLPQARSTLDVPSPGEGFITGIETEAVGLAAVALGAGRQRVDSRIDPAVGFTLLRKVGEPVKRGEPLVRIHFNEPGGVEDVKARLLSAYGFGPVAPAPRPLILERVE